VAASSAAPGPLGRRKGPLFDAHRDDPEFDYWFMVDEALEPGEPMAERPAGRSAGTWAGGPHMARSAATARSQDRRCTTTCAPSPTRTA
jgi:hypothetical protein